MLSIFFRNQLVIFVIVVHNRPNKNCVSNTRPTHRTTLREVMRLWKQNVSKISAKMDNFLFLKRNLSSDNTFFFYKPTRFCRPMWSETHLFFFWPNNISLRPHIVPRLIKICDEMFLPQNFGVRFILKCFWGLVVAYIYIYIYIYNI